MSCNAKKDPNGTWRIQYHWTDCVPETGFCIHALNAVYIKSLDSWIRLDARENKTGVEAQFNLEKERLAFPIRKQKKCIVWKKLIFLRAK